MFCQAAAAAVLAPAAAIDKGGNTPINSCWKIRHRTARLLCCRRNGVAAAAADHDVAIVVASDSEECRGTAYHRSRRCRLAAAFAESAAPCRQSDRDKLYQLLAGSKDLISCDVQRRAQLSDVSRSRLSFQKFPPGHSFWSLSARAVRMASASLNSTMESGRYYLKERPEQDFFVSRFVDYASEDRLFRKYRVAFVEGRPYACHMAIADRWDIWYLNAGMSENAAKRLEEETFMRTFDIGFARRHRAALADMADRIGLDYFTIDCAETKRGELLLFEADNTAVVHNMDSPAVFPYKPPQMRLIFEAFAGMLHRRRREGREQAA
jgi:hypothetical protein